MRSQLERGIILHLRPFKETSFVLDFFSVRQGRISLLAKGAKRPRSPFKAWMHPFIELMASWVGQTELKTLTQIDGQTPLIGLPTECLRVGLYLNELLIKLLAPGDPCPLLYEAYIQALKAIKQSPKGDPQNILRQFEQCLFQELGYGVDCTQDCQHNPIDPEQSYGYALDEGFVPITTRNVLQFSFYTLGSSLIELKNGHLTCEQTLKEAKRLNRFVISHLLGNRPLLSRHLFVEYNKKQKVK